MIIYNRLHYGQIVSYHVSDLMSITEFYFTAFENVRRRIKMSLLISFTSKSLNKSEYTVTIFIIICWVKFKFSLHARQML